MITKNMVKKGIEEGWILFIKCPNFGSGTVCKIGENWFYFGGTTAEELDPEEYLEQVPVDDIVNEIFDVMEDFRTDSFFEDEYAYYEAYLREKGIKDPNDEKTLLCVNFLDTPDENGNTRCVQYLALVKGAFDPASLEDSFSAYLETPEANETGFDQIVETVLNAEDFEWKYIQKNEPIPACDRFECMFI